MIYLKKVHIRLTGTSTTRIIRFVYLCIIRNVHCAYNIHTTYTVVRADIGQVCRLVSLTDLGRYKNCSIACDDERDKPRLGKRDENDVYHGSVWIQLRDSREMFNYRVLDDNRMSGAEIITKSFAIPTVTVEHY